MDIVVISTIALMNFLNQQRKLELIQKKEKD